MDIDFQPVRLCDKERFNRYLSGRYYDLITYNFSTFWLWRDWDPYSWAVIDDALCVTSDYLGLDTVLVPISPMDGRILKATETLLGWYEDTGRPFVMSEVSEAMLDFYQRHMPGCFAAEEYPPGHNYIYRRKDLAELPGKKYDGKRNHLRHFFNEHPDYLFTEITPALVPACKQEVRRWTEQHHPGDPEVAQELLGVLDGLDHLGELDFKTGCLVTGGRPAAFCFGEPLNADTWCIHVEKGDIEVRGAYQAINYLFVRHFCQDAAYINRAEDMGNDGQRQAKSSYHPCCFAKKYYLRLK